MKVLKGLEGEEFNKQNQIKYQVLLIQAKLYRPNNLPSSYRKLYDTPSLDSIDYETAREIFDLSGYEDPPMRGRQSVNPLNKLGFSIARAGVGRIRITELGNQFLEGDYDIGSIFFKSLVKLQFPNPWSIDFTSQDGFNVNPFVATLRLIDRLNQRTAIHGLSKREFCIFVPTLINADHMRDQEEKILEYREAADKEEFIREFCAEFYGAESISDKKINNLYDYGDNTTRYFRLTRYFKVKLDETGSFCRIDLEPTRLVEIRQLLEMYDGTAGKFNTQKDYIDYLSDISKPELPWEEIGNLKTIASSLESNIASRVVSEGIQISKDDREVVDRNITGLTKFTLDEHIAKLRKINVDIKKKINKRAIVNNTEKLSWIISVLNNMKFLRKFKPEQFEKLISDALQIINDEIEIKPNYPVDDNNEPISHAPPRKSDIECYYNTFLATCEVTLNCSKLQWVHEGQPIMRHLRAFENNNKDDSVFCLFVAPKIHQDTISQFWFAVKYEYDGNPQKIVPLNVKEFAGILETLHELLVKEKRFSHIELHELYRQLVVSTADLSGFSEWEQKIPVVLNSWRQDISQRYA